MYQKYVKRAADVTLSLMLLPFFVLLSLVIIPSILLDDFGPVFYCAKRVGRKGKIFPMYKFRSMKVGAPDLRNEDGTTFNSEEDFRVTKVGRILRKTSLDELPQILNVLKGDMSFIGPRPDLPDALSLYKGKTKEKLEVLPGITGYSQACYRNASTLKQRFAKDVYYARHVSFRLDLWIIFRTLGIVFGRKNVYRNEGETNEAVKR